MNDNQMNDDTKAMHQDFVKIMSKFLGPQEIHPQIFEKFVELEVAVNKLSIELHKVDKAVKLIQGLNTDELEEKFEGIQHDIIRQLK
jgi:hypothetical protein